ncbi:hypothetical protein [Alteribacillus bidgolensis]|uniref:hypothetical protein n=1 Tax=Alteribacillus bidgolensis TaxID=930129 RepID=UPI001113CCA4|nr:hypothetical protein [Alteribacillus bidgolensis]
MKWSAKEVCTQHRKAEMPLLPQNAAFLGSFLYKAASKLSLSKMYHIGKIQFSFETSSPQKGCEESLSREYQGLALY